MEEKEIWKPLFKQLGRLDGVFLVSNSGRIKDGLNDRIFKPNVWKGYQIVTLYHNFKKLTGILNNRADNLEWYDPKYNRQYGTDSERMVNTKKKNGSIQKIHQLTLDGKHIAEYEMVKIFKQKTNICQSSIYNCYRRFYKKIGGYVFLFDKDYKYLKNNDGSVDIELLCHNGAFRERLFKKRGGLSYKEIKLPS